MRLSESGESPIRSGVDRIYSGYAAGDEMPLGGYTLIIALFGIVMVMLGIAARRQQEREVHGFRARLWRRLRRPMAPSKGPRWIEIGLLGIATHKLTRIITKDWVTAPLRAPFTEYQESVGTGEVSERSRGHGVQKAIGDLLTCQYCTGPWVAGILTAGLVFVPRLTRYVAGALAMVVVSDWLHVTYERMRGK